MFVSANKFCGCWLKKFWSIRKALPFATPSRFRKHKRVLPRADRQRLKPCLRRPLNHQVIYCVRGVFIAPSFFVFAKQGGGLMPRASLGLGVLFFTCLTVPPLLNA